MTTDPVRVPRPLPSAAALLVAVGLAALLLPASGVTVAVLALAGDCHLAVLGGITAILAPGCVTLSVLFVARARQRPTTTARFLGRGALYGLLAALVAVVIVDVIVSVTSMHLLPALGTALTVSTALLMVGGYLVEALVAAGIGAALGVGLSALYRIPLRALTRARGWDARDRFHLTLGAWSAVLAATCAAAMGVALTAHPPYRNVDGALLLLHLLGVTGAAGLGLALWAALRRWHRGRWLDRVARGRVPGWRLVPSSAVDADAAGALLVVGPPPYSGVLAREARTARGAAYREHDALGPVARVRLP